MNQTIVIDAKIGIEMLEVFRNLRDEVSLLRKTLSSVALRPKYGTDLWWEMMDKKAMQDIEQGLGVKLNSKDDIDIFFKNLQ